MQLRTAMFGLLALVGVMTLGIYSFTVATALPPSRVTEVQGLSLGEVISAFGSQVVKEEKGLQSILVFSKSGGSQETGNFQPDLRVDSIVDVGPEDRQVGFQYYVDIDDDLTGATTAHCSDVKLHILLDGKEVHVTDWLGYEGRDPSLPLQTEKIMINKVPPGEHYVGLVPEGRVSGCNTQGYVLSWGGTLAVYE